MSNDSSSLEAGYSPKLNYGPVSAVLVTIIAFFASQLLAVLPFIAYDELRGQAAGNSLESSLSKLLVSGLIALIMFTFLKRYLEHRQNSMHDIGLARPLTSDAGLAVGGFFVYFLSFVLITPIVKLLVPEIDLEQNQDLGFAVKDGLIVLVISLVIIPPIIEEIVMRGFLFSGLRTKLNFWISTIITSIVFGLAHLPGGEGGPLWIGAVDTFLLSVVLCYLREKTGSLAAPIMLHMIKNGLALTYLVNIG